MFAVYLREINFEDMESLTESFCSIDDWENSFFISASVILYGSSWNLSIIKQEL